MLSKNLESKGQIPALLGTEYTIKSCLGTRETNNRPRRAVPTNHCSPLFGGCLRRFSASLIVDTSRFANRILATARTGTGWYFNLDTASRDTVRTPWAVPLRPRRVMCSMASGAVHSPERTRNSVRSTMNGRPIPTVGRQSACSSWTDPYGIAHRRRPKPARPGILECVPRCRAVADRFGGLQCRRLASSPAPGRPRTLGTPRTRSWCKYAWLGPMAMDAPFAVTPLRLGSVCQCRSNFPQLLE